jgi:uncharacterized protein (TIGR00270 family)
MEKGYLVRIEGAVLLVCGSCAERGEIIREVREEEQKTVKEGYADLVDDFGERIREARKRLHMDYKHLSKETGISIRVLRDIEAQKIYPTEEQARKLEKVLGIEPIEEEGSTSSSDDFQLTLGDVVRIR